MKLTYFSIRDYRSITSAELDNLQSSTILIGPNNEGKSNVLQALNACLTLLRSERPIRSGDKLQLRYDRESFDWSTDYPVRKQLANKTGESVFELHFQLSEPEQAAFHEATGSKLNDVLPIQISFGPNQFASFKVLKQGRGGVALSKKPEPICRFIARTLDFAYIPAIRTANASLDVVNELVSRELRQLEKNDRYAALQKELLELQKPLLDGIAAKLKTNLQGFLGAGLRDVTLNLVDRYRSQRFGRTCQITVDDGTPTLLERKGDGVQSLAAISLMIGALQEAGVDKDIIVLLEEPESHLHPKAIHQLREVLDTLRQDSQLIVTTHCPLLVNRANVASNLIVSKNKASPAESLTALRDILGVRTSDNLQHAALIVVVEGPEDEVALRALLPHYSAKLGEALTKGSLTFHVLGGASKLPYALSLLQSSICNYYIFLDDDDEGRKGFYEAQKSLMASPSNTSFTACLGLPEAEFEDLLSESIYSAYFKSKHSVDVGHAPFNTKNKWSRRMRLGFTKAGKATSVKVNPDGTTTKEHWPETMEYADKRAIAELVVKNPTGAIHPSREDTLKCFVAAVEARLDAIKS
jgi:putative ATP-dependent endonuclease of OLD family